MQQDNTAILPIPGELNSGGNLLTLSALLNPLFSNMDYITGLEFEGFLFKDGKTLTAGCKGTTSETVDGYTKLAISGSTGPYQAINVFYHTATGDYRVDADGIPLDNVVNIILKIQREDLNRRRRVTDTDDGFDTTATSAQFTPKVDARYGRRHSGIQPHERINDMLLIAKEATDSARKEFEASGQESCDHMAKRILEITLTLNQMRDKAIARSNEDVFVIAKVWGVSEERVLQLRTPPGDNA